ncbi:hypothetical protein GCM10020295_34990 [Streptomyces cinereospinus]
MLLTIDVGNTHTVLGLFDGDDIVEHWRISTDARRTADELAVLLQGLMGMHPPCSATTWATASTASRSARRSPRSCTNSAR